MPPTIVWLSSLRKSMHCRSQPSDVHDPKSSKVYYNQGSSILTKRSGCSRSIANLRDVVIHGSSRRHSSSEEEKPQPASCSSPMSIGSTDFINPITHEVILSSDSKSKCELKITGVGNCHEGILETLKPGTPGPYSLKGLTPPRRLHSIGGSSPFRAPVVFDLNVVVCHRCGEQFGKMEALEAHHLSKHAVTELVEGDSSRKIVEIICKASLSKSESTFGRIERIFKIHNTQKTLACFEEYRELVKARASKLPKKHPRCLADGNELLRFYGTTVSCLLGSNGSSNLCSSEKCNICRIIWQGFSMKKDSKGGIGVFTTSTSGNALESVQIYDNKDFSIKKALIVCRVIAGRVHKPLENYQDFENQSGFDSLAGKVGMYSNIEELYLLNPRALLPCFVVICKS